MRAVCVVLEQQVCRTIVLPPHLPVCPPLYRTRVEVSGVAEALIADLNQLHHLCLHSAVQQTSPQYLQCPSLTLPLRALDGGISFHRLHGDVQSFAPFHNEWVVGYVSVAIYQFCPLPPSDSFISSVTSVLFFTAPTLFLQHHYSGSFQVSLLLLSPAHFVNSLLIFVFFFFFDYSTYLSVIQDPWP